MEEFQDRIWLASEVEEKVMLKSTKEEGINPVFNDLPRLAVEKVTGIIILLTDTWCVNKKRHWVGTVLYSEHPDIKVGDHDDEWPGMEFTPFRGSIHTTSE